VYRIINPNKDGKRLKNSEQALKIKSEIFEVKISGSRKGMDMKVQKFHRDLKNQL